MKENDGIVVYRVWRNNPPKRGMGIGRYEEQLTFKMLAPIERRSRVGVLVWLDGVGILQ
jgi:hypothetical protein